MSEINKEEFLEKLKGLAYKVIGKNDEIKVFSSINFITDCYILDLQYEKYAMVYLEYCNKGIDDYNYLVKKRKIYKYDIPSLELKDKGPEYCLNKLEEDIRKDWEIERSR